MSQTSEVTIEKTLQIAASPETVWQYWVDPVRMATWWGVPSTLEAKPGGSCRIEMNEGPVMVGQYLELDPYQRLVFSFGWEGNEPGEPLAPGSSRVEVLLAPKDGGTLLTLRHHDMPDTHAADHGNGWEHFLGILAEQVANGGS